jgi:predicted DNA-binding protein
MTLTVRLSKFNEEMLSSLTSKTGESKSYCVNRALEEYLEDQLDYFEAEKAINEMKDLEAQGIQTARSLDEIVRERGYDL